MLELPAVQRHHQRGVVVQDGKVGQAVLQVMHRIRQRTGGDAQLAIGQIGLQPHQPVGHDGARQGAAGAQRHGAALAACNGHEFVVRLREVARHLQRGVQKRLARSRELDGAGLSLDQRRARPGLQRANAAPKGRVGDMAQLGRAGEAALLRQRHEVLQPFQLHGRGSWVERVGPQGKDGLGRALRRCARPPAPRGCAGPQRGRPRQSRRPKRRTARHAKNSR